MKAFEYCDAVKEKTGIESHYALAKRLGVTRQSITKLYAGGTFFPATAVKVAEILEIDPLQVIADSELERAKRPEDRALWQRLAVRVAAAVVVGIGVGGFFAGMVPGDALPSMTVAASHPVYIMLNNMRSQVVDFMPFALAVALIGWLLTHRR